MMMTVEGLLLIGGEFGDGGLKVDAPAARRPASYSPDAWRYAAARIRQYLAAIPHRDTTTLDYH